MDELKKIGIALSKEDVNTHATELINDVIDVGKTVNTDEALRKDLFQYNAILNF